MTVDREQQNELCGLLLAMENGTISSEGLERIDRLVCGSTDSLRLYAKYMRLVSDLRFGSGDLRIEATLAKLFDTEGSTAKDGCSTRPVGETERLAPRVPVICGEAVHGGFGWFNSGWPVAYLVATVANTETGSELGQSLYADIWVFVDGHERFKRREVNYYTGVLSVDIPINNRDRYLTLAATDSGNGASYDWIMFGDPRLELTTENVSQATASSAHKGSRDGRNSDRKNAIRGPTGRSESGEPPPK